MQVTAIRRQQRNVNRFSIYVDAKYSFSLGETELVNQSIFIGRELDKETLNKLRIISNNDKLYSKLLNLLSIRPRSRHELVLYLKRNKAEPKLADELLNKLSNSKLIDDDRFAGMWVRSRRQAKSASLRRITMELRQKGVAESSIKSALAEESIDDRSALTKLVEKKRRSSRYQDKLKLMQYLVRQGYSYDLVKEVLAVDDVA